MLPSRAMLKPIVAGAPDFFGTGGMGPSSLTPSGCDPESI
jgi:hypothetical protein